MILKLLLLLVILDFFAYINSFLLCDLLCDVFVDLKTGCLIKECQAICNVHTHTYMHTLICPFYCLPLFYFSTFGHVCIFMHLDLLFLCFMVFTIIMYFESLSSEYCEIIAFTTSIDLSDYSCVSSALVLV